MRVLQRGCIVGWLAVASACQGNADRESTPGLTASDGGAPGAGGRVGASDGAVASAGGIAGTPDAGPDGRDSGALDAARGTVGAPSDGADAGGAPTCLFPVPLPRPTAGDGARSGCPAKQCVGLPATADLSETFTADWPASLYQGCTKVTGSIVVASSQNADLSELACLERVDGDLLVWNDPGLTSLHGLESLTVVSGSFGIGYTGSLTASNTNLKTLDGLSGLTVVGGNLHVALDTPTPPLSGLDALVAVGGSLEIDLSHRVNDPPFGTVLSGFGALTSIGGDLSLWDYSAIKTLNAFGALARIGGSIYVAGAWELTSFALPSLSCLGKDLSIQQGYLDPNRALTAVGPFPKLRDIGGWVRIEGNPALTSVQLFDTVQSVDGGTIRMVDNPVLTTFPVSALAHVADDIVISKCPELDPCPLMDLYSRLKANGYPYFMSLDSVTKCNGGQSCDGPVCVAP